MKLVNSIKQGLKEAVEYEKGNLKARKQVIRINPVPHYKSEKIKQIRAKTGLSQIAFSSLLGVSVKTVEAWESGRNIPQGPAQRMLELIEKEPEMIKKHILKE